VPCNIVVNMNESSFATVVEFDSPLCQPFADDYVEPMTSADPLPKNPMPEEIPVSEATYPIDRPVCESIDNELDDLRKQMKILKNQIVTALDQLKSASEREESALLQAKQAAENEQTAVANLSEAAGREEYLLELMSTAGEEMIGKPRGALESITV